MSGEPRRIGGSIVVAVLVLAVVAVALIVHRARQPDRVVGLNVPVQYDDYRFTVTGARTVSGAPGGMVRHVVDLRVDNRAKRVSFRFHRAMAVLVDAWGQVYPVSAAGQKDLDEARGGPDPLSVPLPAGQSATTRLAFDLPANAPEPSLRIASGFALGEVLTVIFEGRTRIRLQPSEPR